MANKKFDASGDVDETAGEDLATTVALLQQQVAALLTAQASGGGITEDRLERILLKTNQVAADAAERAANPSNRTHPEISVFSYPEGDRAKPRAMKCEMYWCGYDLGLDTTTAEEIELLNQAGPGEYAFRRTANEMDTLTIEGKRNAAGKLTRLEFSYVVKDRSEPEGGMVGTLRSALRVKSPQEIELESLKRQLEAMKAEKVSA